MSPSDDGPEASASDRSTPPPPPSLPPPPPSPSPAAAVSAVLRLFDRSKDHENRRRRQRLRTNDSNDGSVGPGVRSDGDDSTMSTTEDAAKEMLEQRRRAAAATAALADFAFGSDGPLSAIDDGGGFLDGGVLDDEAVGDSSGSDSDSDSDSGSGSGKSRGEGKVDKAAEMQEEKADRTRRVDKEGVAVNAAVATAPAPASASQCPDCSEESSLLNWNKCANKDSANADAGVTSAVSTSSSSSSLSPSLSPHRESNATADSLVGPAPGECGSEEAGKIGGPSHLDLATSFGEFSRDASALLGSDEFERLASSTCRLAAAATSAAASTAISASRAAVGIALLPVSAPLSVASSAAATVAHVTVTVGGTALGIAGEAAERAWQVAIGLVIAPSSAATGGGGADPCDDSGDEQGQRGRRSFISDPLGALLPVLVSVVGRVSDEIGSAALGLLGLQSAGQSSSEGTGDLVGRFGAPVVFDVRNGNGDVKDDGDCDDDEEEEEEEEEKEELWVRCNGDEDKSYFDKAASCAGEDTNVGDLTRKLKVEEKMPLGRLRSFMRVCDLNLSSSSDPVTGGRSKVIFVELTPKPIYDAREDHWLSFDGVAEAALDALARRGLALASSAFLSQVTRDEWKPDKATAQLLSRFSAHASRRHEFNSVLDREVLLWSCCTGDGNTAASSSAYGKGAPLFRGRGIVPGLSPTTFADLLLDSDRVGEYNKYAIERVDELVLMRRRRWRREGLFDDGDNDDRDGIGNMTKVVRSVNRVPFGGRTVTLRNVMHASKLSNVSRALSEVEAFAGGDEEDEMGLDSTAIDGYVIVSRSVSESHCDSGAFPASIVLEEAENEIIWCVNVLREVPGRPDATDLTCVSQVSSTLVPMFLQERMGVMGVAEFFRSTRALGAKVRCY